jgi:hypothetical protein
MAWLDLAGDEVVVRLSLAERIGAFVGGDARIPLRSIRRARAVDDPWSELRGIRAPGTGWSRHLALGTWRFSGGKDWVALRGRGPAVALDLQGLEYARVLVSARDAAALAAEIEEAADAARPR